MDPSQQWEGLPPGNTLGQAGPAPAPQPSGWFALPPPPTDAAAAPSPAEPPPAGDALDPGDLGNQDAATYFADLGEFVREVICEIYQRPIDRRGEFRWSPRWWDSPEAYLRLMAVWRAYEEMRLEPGAALSMWLRDHADYHMNLLMSPSGPFAQSSCSNEAGRPLPSDDPPPGFFDEG